MIQLISLKLLQSMKRVEELLMLTAELQTKINNKGEGKLTEG
jgi:hypothetical protein